MIAVERECSWAIILTLDLHSNHMVIPWVVGEKNEEEEKRSPTNEWPNEFLPAGLSLRGKVIWCLEGVRKRTAASVEQGQPTWARHMIEIPSMLGSSRDIQQGQGPVYPIC